MLFTALLIAGCGDKEPQTPSLSPADPAAGERLAAGDAGSVLHRLTTALGDGGHPPVSAAGRPPILPLLVIAAIFAATSPACAGTKAAATYRSGRTSRILPR